MSIRCSSVVIVVGLCTFPLSSKLMLFFFLHFSSVNSCRVHHHFLVHLCYYLHKHIFFARSLTTKYKAHNYLPNLIQIYTSRSFRVLCCHLHLYPQPSAIGIGFHTQKQVLRLALIPKMVLSDWPQPSYPFLKPLHLNSMTSRHLILLITGHWTTVSPDHQGK